MNAPYVALITGASTGFGRLLVQTLARRGHIVFASMRGIAEKNAGAASELAAFAAREGVALQAIEMDVTDDVSVRKGIEHVVADAGRLDVVVNNAGATAFGLLETFSLEQARKAFELNLFGPMRVNRAALPILRARKSGLLVQVTSAGARYVLPFFGPYTAAKFAAEALAETYRYELASEGIDSVIVEPGGYGTSLAKNAIMADDTARVATYTRAKELLGAAVRGMTAAASTDNPQEVADAITALIEMPHGKRPLRTVVGRLAKSLLEDLNAATDRIQAERLRALGMSEMLQLK
ncbi:SDR family NAD(P)-dependent oxidoreductase [Pendulispora brunnea]|uniref:SDR family NAD(P)-dependent oxidoreductase n=1 Tax=Pendulispora brunnea TaxID=2905690 RepID=A0ABZ2K4H5_9BACT